MCFNHSIKKTLKKTKQEMEHTNRTKKNRKHGHERGPCSWCMAWNVIFLKTQLMNEPGGHGQGVKAWQVKNLATKKSKNPYPMNPIPNLEPTCFICSAMVGTGTEDALPTFHQDHPTQLSLHGDKDDRDKLNLLRLQLNQAWKPITRL